MKAPAITKRFVIVLSALILISVASCKKSSQAELTTPATPDYGCTSTTILQTMNSTPAQLVYVSTGAFAGDWLLATDYGSTRGYSCVFCDKSVYSAIVAGKSHSTPINVTVSGTIKRRLQNQESITPTSGGGETYIINVSNIQ